MIEIKSMPKNIGFISVMVPTPIYEMIEEIADVYNMPANKMANFLLAEGVKKDWENVETLKRIREECKAKKMKDK